ncbi:MAG: hypothetical protein PPP56_01395 [Longimonas sp.]|uniref:hypothetical protein n=1 Tax=Longimonas sp. TaxID=2039626 RepID=UPI00335C27F7
MPTSSSSSREDVSSQLKEAQESLFSRFDALRDEADDIKTAVRQKLRAYPLVSAAGALAAGWVVGRLLSRPRTRSQWATRYATAVEEDLRAAIESGADADTIVDNVLRDRVPVLVEAAPSPEAPGLLQRAVGGALQIVVQVVLIEVSRRLADRVFDEPSNSADSA